MAKKLNFSQISAKNVTTRVYKVLYNGVKEVAKNWKQFLEDEFDAPKSGHWYWNPRTRQMYQASAFHEYPARKTGDFLEKLLIGAGTYNPSNNFIRLYVISGSIYTTELIEKRPLLFSETAEFKELLKAEIDKLKGGNIKI